MHGFKVGVYPRFHKIVSTYVIPLVLCKAPGLCVGLVLKVAFREIYGSAAVADGENAVYSAGGGRAAKSVVKIINNVQDILAGCCQKCRKSKQGEQFLHVIKVFMLVLETNIPFTVLHPVAI